MKMLGNPAAGKKKLQHLCFVKRLVIFASGKGSNAMSLVRHYRENKKAEVLHIFTNNPLAGVIEPAVLENIPVVILNRKEYFNDPGLVRFLHEQKTDLIVLAGFLWLVPPLLIRSFPEKIINLHPALLPAYGGKGMFGMHVHRAVIAAGEKESGVSFHYVNEQYDKGKIIHQAKIPLSQGETAESLSEKISLLEKEHFPVAIDKALGEGS